MSVTITTLTQLTSGDGTGVQSDIKCGFTTTESGLFNTSLEVMSTNGNWMSCFDCIGSIGADITCTTTEKFIYWQSPEVYGNLEGVTPQFRLVAFFS